MGEDDDLLHLIGEEVKHHAAGPQDLFSRSQGSAETDQDEDDKPEEQESSEDEADPPKALRK